MLRFTSNIIAQMTLDCNLRCSYCFECHQKKWKNQFLTIEQFKQALDTAIYERCILGRIENCLEWHFHGGEVFMLPWEDLKQMIDYIEKRKSFFPGISYGFQTNGTLLSDEIVQYLAQKQISIGISFDGFDDTERMTPEKNKKFFERIKYFQSMYHARFGVLTTFSKKNMKNWASDAKKILTVADEISINLLCASNEKNKKDIPSPEEQYTFWIKPVLESYLTSTPIKERNISLILQRAISDIVFNCISYNTMKSGCYSRICGLYSNMITLRPDLTLQPCDKYLENGKYIDQRYSQKINKRDFLGLQTAKRTISHYNEVFKEEAKLGCDHCEARLICTGECQAYNLSTIGKVQIKNTNCSNYKKIYHFIEENILKILLLHKVPIAEDINSIKSSFLKQVNEANLKICYNENTKLLFLEKLND